MTDDIRESAEKWADALRRERAARAAVWVLIAPILERAAKAYRAAEDAVAESVRWDPKLRDASKRYATMAVWNYMGWRACDGVVWADGLVETYDGGVVVEGMGVGGDSDQERLSWERLEKIERAAESMEGFVRSSGTLMREIVQRAFEASEAADAALAVQRDAVRREAERAEVIRKARALGLEVVEP